MATKAEIRIDALMAETQEKILAKATELIETTEEQIVANLMKGGWTSQLVSAVKEISEELQRYQAHLNGLRSALVVANEIHEPEVPQQIVKARAMDHLSRRSALLSIVERSLANRTAQPTPPRAVAYLDDLERRMTR